MRLLLPAWGMRYSRRVRRAKVPLKTERTDGAHAAALRKVQQDVGPDDMPAHPARMR